jgi:mono/diheme cytochrome c family protein
VSFVKNGAGGMPAFRDRMSEAEIQAVVDFTRTALQSK